MQTISYLPSKPRYEILDGLRGVAAMIVVIYHLFEVYYEAPIFDHPLGHGYLAVDFFFALSGFVIGYAYDDRWNRMTTWDFFKRRLVRLHPMVIFGTLFGAALFYLGGSPDFPLIMETPWWKVMLMAVLGCLMIPALTSWDIRGWAETNPLDGPTWSLSWEYIANICYALFIRHFSKVTLAVFVVLSAYLTLDVTLNIDIFGLLAERGNTAGSVMGGWCLNPEQLYIGLSRLLYPFFSGLLISRIHKLITVKGGFYWCSLLIVVLLVMPHWGGRTELWKNGAYEAFCILVMFPLVVSMGAGSRVTGKRSVALCKFMGDISYPLYLTHYPLVYMQMGWVSRHADAPWGTHVFFSVSLFFLSILLAYACLKMYDEPVREWLKQRFLMKKKTSR